MPENKLKLCLKNLAILPSYFDLIFVLLRQKVHLKPELSPKFLSAFGPNPTPTRPLPDPYATRTLTRSESEPDPKSPARLTTLNNSDVDQYLF